MSRLQPVGQKRLTNVCIVRLKRCGKRFEVAAYRNTVIAWRDKVEKDIDEVLQVHTIYANLDKGILAKSEDLVEAFGTDDEDTICVEILNKGEFQVSEQERQMQVEALFRDVASRVADMCVDPKTQRPYPLSTIERAMRETLHFAPQVNKAAKQQALHVVKQLEASDVLPIMRAKMRLRLFFSDASQVEGALASMRKLGAEASSSSSSSSSSAPTATSAAAESKLVLLPLDGDGSIQCHADPILYRPLSELAKSLGGTLQVIELKASTLAPDGASASAGTPAPVPPAAVAPPAATAPPTAATPSAPATQSATPREGGKGGGGRGGGAAGRGSGGGDADARRAERMFKLNLRNAEKGDPVAQLEVGKAYLDGKGVVADPAEGRRWLEEAKQQGVQQAVSRLEALAIS